MSENINIKNLLIFQFIHVFTIPLGFLIRIFYSKTLTLQEFGFIYSLVSFFTFLGLFVNFGLSGSLKYHIPKFLAKKDYDSIRNIFWYSYFLSFLILILISVIIFLFSKYLAIHYFGNIEILYFIKIWIIFFIFVNLTSFIQDVFLAFKKNINYMLIRFIQLFLILIFSLSFIYFKFSNLGIIFSYIWGFANLLIFLFYLIFLFKLFPFIFKFPKFNKKLMNQHLKYSLGIFSFNLSNQIFAQTDMLVIIYFLSTSFAGIYSNILAIVNIFVSFFVIIGNIFMPLFSELQEKNLFSQLASILIFFYSNIFYMLFPLSIFILVFAKEILLALYGTEFVSGYLILQLLLIFIVFKIVYIYNLNFLSGLGKIKILNKIILVITIFNLLFNILIIKNYGLDGVALITGISWLIIAVSSYYVLKKEIKFNLNFLNFVKIVFLNIIYYFLLIFLKNYIYYVNKYITGITIFGISLLTYVILGYLFKIYSLETVYIFIPDSKFKKNIIKFQKNYFSFLK